jgi:hypothetical protein
MRKYSDSISFDSIFSAGDIDFSDSSGKGNAFNNNFHFDDDDVK